MLEPEEAELPETTLSQPHPLRACGEANAWIPEKDYEGLSNGNPPGRICRYGQSSTPFEVTSLLRE